MSGRRSFGPITRPAELASWVMMGSKHKGRSTLLIEGITDAQAFVPFADGETCRIIAAEGKDNVLGAMDIIRRSSYAGAFAVVDADFDHLEGRRVTLNDVAQTDTHDLETMILATNAFKKVLLRNGYFGRLGIEIDIEDMDTRASDLQNRLLNCGCRLAYLRWASRIHSLGISFASVDLSKVLDPSTLVIREDRLEEAVLRSSTVSAGPWAKIDSLAQAIKNPAHDRWQLCNGHDLMMMLALHLSRITGTSISKSSVEADLISAYGFDDFKKTMLHTHIARWQQDNHPRRILRL